MIGFAVISGWREAPHQWRAYLRRPVRFERNVAWTMIQLLGVVIFFYRK